MRSQHIYEQLDYHPTAQSTPIRSASDYIEDIETYIDYYVKSSLQRKLCRWAALLWVKVSGFHRFVTEMNVEDRDLYYKTVDKMQGYRESLLALNYSILLENDERHNDAVERAVSLIYAATCIRQDILTGALKRDTIGSTPLEMGQYANLFGTHLIAGRPDVIFKTTASDYIVVMYAGHFFRLDISGPMSLAALRLSLEGILETSLEPYKDSWGVGLLSGSHRDLTAKWTRLLLKDEKNQQNFEVLNNALFVLNLDSGTPAYDDEAHRLLQSGHAFNRWYHTSLQIVVFANARSGIVLSNRNYIDGNCGSRFASELYTRALQMPRVDEPFFYSSQPSKITPFEWVLPVSAVSEWVTDVNRYVRSTPDSFTLTGVGRQRLQNSSASPDLLTKVALLWACKSHFNRDVKIIQLVNASRFKYMGLNHAFVSTPAVLELLDHLISQRQLEGASPETQRLLFSAIESYKKAQHKARIGMPVLHVLSYWMHLASPLKKIFSLLLMIGTGLLKCKSDSITSHPAIYPGVRAFGRPGIWLPYLELFGLHYVIREDETNFIFMPAMGLNIDMAQLAADTKKNVLFLHGLLVSENINEKTSEKIDSMVTAERGLHEAATNYSGHSFD